MMRTLFETVIMVVFGTVLLSCNKDKTKPTEEPFLYVKTTQVVFSAQGATRTISCYSNANIEAVSSHPSWCEATVTNNETIEIRAWSNTGQQERTAIVTVTSGKAADIQIEVRQVSNSELLCVQMDPLDRVFLEDFSFAENSDIAVIAKGETVTFQFVFRCEEYAISNLKIEAGNLAGGSRQIAPALKAFVRYIRAGLHATTPSKDAVFPSSDNYPDCLEEVGSMNVSKGRNQPVYVSYAIPRDAVSGDYSAPLVFTGTVDDKPFEITIKVNARVYPVTLPEQTLWVTNWWRSHYLSKMNGDQPVELYSNRYWELLTELAHVMRDHGQNTYILDRRNWGDLCNIKLTGTQYSFDFTNFDKMVDLLIREGGLKRIEGCFLGSRLGTWISDFGVILPDETIVPFDDGRAQNFLTQFLPALYAHLETKGWTSMYMQHVADEPIDQNASSYGRIADFVKNHLPGIPIIDAIKTNRLSNIVDINVPVLQHFHSEYSYYQGRQAAGDEVWFYTCNEPEGNYANRFMELPLIQTRFLHWINYRYGATGYLHWGLNYWVENAQIAGDCYIVYPAFGKVYTSVRLAAMRDGIADYELLKLLERKAPDKAKELAGEVIRGFADYNNNISDFRQTRLKLLQALSE